MVWVKTPLVDNDLVVQQDSLVVSDSLILSDSIIIDTSSVLIVPDSIPVVPANIPLILPSDTNKHPSSNNIESADTRETGSRHASVPDQDTTYTEVLNNKELTTGGADFVYDSTLFQTEWTPGKPVLSFPANILLLKDESKNPKQSDFFIYEKNHKKEPGKTSIAGLDSGTEILIHGRNSDNGSGWLLGVFIIILILLARMKLLFGKFIPAIISSCFSHRVVQNLYRNRNTLLFQAGLNLDFIYFLSSGVFILQLIKYFDIYPGLVSDFTIFLFAVGGLFALMVLKYFICKLSGFVSLNTALFNEYFHSILIYNKNIGLFLVPVTLGMAYIHPGLNKVFVFAGLGIVSIAYILQVIRLIQLFNTKRISSFYSILYLCALEILPVLLLVRVLVPLNKV